MPVRGFKGTGFMFFFFFFFLGGGPRHTFSFSAFHGGMCCGHVLPACGGAR